MAACWSTLLAQVRDETSGSCFAVQRLERGLSGVGLGRFFRASGAPAEFLTSERNGSGVVAIVVGTLGGEFFISGDFPVVVFLGPFLQLAFWVLTAFTQLDGFDLIAEKMENHLLGSFDASVEKDRPNERFEGIFEHRMTRFRAVLAVCFADLEVGGQSFAHCDAGE